MTVVCIAVPVGVAVVVVAWVVRRGRHATAHKEPDSEPN